MVTGSLVDKDVLCNAWELSLSWEQVAETQPISDENSLTDKLLKSRQSPEFLQECIVELENKLAKKEIEYTDLWDDALELQERIAKLKAFIDQLVDTGDQLENQTYDAWRQYKTLDFPAAETWRELVAEWNKSDL